MKHMSQNTELRPISYKSKLPMHVQRNPSGCGGVEGVGLIGFSRCLASFLESSSVIQSNSKMTWSHGWKSLGPTHQLIQVPPADTEVALVFVHTLAEVANVSLAGGRLPCTVVRAALVQAIVHRLGLGWRSLLGLRRGATEGAR